MKNSHTVKQPQYKFKYQTKIKISNATMLVLVFRKKNSGIDVDLVSEGNGVSLRQATVGRPHTLRSSV